MSALQQAADFFAREAARYAGLKEAAERFTTAAALEAHVQELQGKADRLSKELGIEGMQSQAIALTRKIKELTSEADAIEGRVTAARAVHSDLVAKNVAHEEKAKTWNGEAERVLAKARADAETIIEQAKSEGQSRGNSEASAIVSNAQAKAAADAQAYAAGRKAELSGLEKKIGSAKQTLASVNGQIAEAKAEHERVTSLHAELVARITK